MDSIYLHVGTKIRSVTGMWEIIGFNVFTNIDGNLQTDVRLSNIEKPDFLTMEAGLLLKSIQSGKSAILQN